MSFRLEGRDHFLLAQARAGKCFYSKIDFHDRRRISTLMTHGYAYRTRDTGSILLTRKGEDVVLGFNVPSPALVQVE